MKKNTRLIVGALVMAFAMPAMAQQAQSKKIEKPIKVVDGASAFHLLGRKIRHGAGHAKNGVGHALHFVYKRGVRPVAIGARDGGEAVVNGTIFFAIEVKKGVVTVSDAVADGVEIAYDDAIHPYIEKPLIEAGKIIALDGAYDMILKPLAIGLEQTAKNDMVTGVEAAFSVEKDGAQKAASDISNDSVKFYQVVLKPVGEGIEFGAQETAKAASFVARQSASGIVWVADCLRDDPTKCETADDQAGAKMSTKDVRP